MKKQLLIIFALISFSGMSQSNWIKENAVWHFQYSNISNGWIKVWDDGDTVVQNITCTKLKSKKHEFFITGPDGGMMETESDYIDGIIYYQNDTVFYWDYNHFSVLYDFNALTGDSWILHHSAAPSFGCNDTSICQVTNVDNVVLGGNSYKQLYLSPSSDANVQVNGNVNARFGTIGSYILPFGRSCDGTIVEFDQISLICFQDDSLYYNPTGGACEYYLGLNESAKTLISVFPNPSSGKIELLSDVPLTQIKVMNVLGVVLKKVDTEFTMKEIDLSELPQGTYYLDIENQNGEKIVKTIQLSGR